MNRAGKVPGENPTRNDRERCLRHDCIFENEVGVFRLDVEERVSYLVEGIVFKDEEIAPKGHR